MHRRDFIKRAAMGAAAAGLAGVAGGSRKALAGPGPGQYKMVFISDIHMNQDASYSWFKDHAVDLAAFLEQLDRRSEVYALVIMGDLVDDWVDPLVNRPQSFSDVLGASTNADVVAMLQRVCRNSDIEVTYLTGNHDLLSFESENRKVLEDTFPGMTVISDEPGLGSYSAYDLIWAEHGHRYTLFNAPDIWSRLGSHLPLGYFISRLAADKSVSEGRVYTMPDVLDTFVKSPELVHQTLTQGGLAGLSDDARNGIIDDAFIVAVFNAIALWSGNGPFSRFYTDGLDGYTTSPMVEGIALTHDQVYGKWNQRMNRVQPYEAVLNDLGSLYSAANLLFEMPDRIKSFYPFTPQIVLFGHTHEACLQYQSGAVETIYANTGTWIDGKPETWVEIDTAIGQGKYTVELWFYGESTARQSATVNLSS